MDASDFQSFQQRLRLGDSAAYVELFDEFAQKLVRLASEHIHPALVKRFDGEDVVQSVFRTFFRRHEEGGFHIEHSQQLWRLLVTLTLCKTRSLARKHTAEKRNVHVDRAMNDAHPLLDQQPSVEDALALWEEIDIVLRGLPERTATIISMRLEGKTRSEIAQELNLSRQTIHRILKLVEERLDQQLNRFCLAELEDSTVSEEKDSESM